MTPTSTPYAKDDHRLDMHELHRRPSCSDSLPTWATKADAQRREASWVGKQIMILAGTCALLAALKFAAERFFN